MSAIAAAPTDTQQPTDRARWLALYTLCVGMLMIILDGTIVNVALPSIQDDLGFSQSSLAWVVNAYLIPFGGLLLLAGRIGDLIGRKRVFTVGLALFVAASALCGLAQSQETLIGARFLQGIGGALTSSVILGMIVTMFPEKREQAKAIGVYSFVAASGASLGLLAGGILTEAISWHWIFFVNLPFGLAAMAFSTRLIPNDEGIGLDKGADVPGAVLITGGLMLAVYTIVEAANYGWGSLHTLGLGAVAIALVAGFVARQSRAATPLMPLRVLRSRNVSGANLIQVLMVAGLFGMFFLGALYLQRVLGYGPVEVGLAFLPVAVLIALLSLQVTDKVILRFGPRNTLLAGLGFVLPVCSCSRVCRLTAATPPTSCRRCCCSAPVPDSASPRWSRSRCRPSAPPSPPTRRTTCWPMEPRAPPPWWTAISWPSRSAQASSPWRSRWPRRCSSP